MPGAGPIDPIYETYYNPAQGPGPLRRIIGDRAATTQAPAPTLPDFTQGGFDQEGLAGQETTPPWGTNQPFGGYAGDVGANYGLFGPSDTGAGQPVGAPGQADIRGIYDQMDKSYVGGKEVQPPINPSDKAGAGLGGTRTATAAAGAPLLPGDQRNAAQQKSANQQVLFNKLLAMLGMNPADFAPAAVPDFREDAMRQAELMRRRAGQRGAEEAAATGGAGSRDLAYRQSLLDEALFNAGGQIGAEQSGRQFQANVQAKALEAAQRQAEFKQVMAMLQALGSITG
jgi:hypothetical protein